MSPEHLEISRPVGGVLQIVLNRPRQLNSLNRQIIQELSVAVEEFETSGDEILILSGAGRAFCFGADFQEFEKRDDLPDLLFLFQRLILKLYNCPKITVACLNGFATGAGLDLALACDFRMAAEKVKLGEAYISMGLVSDGGGTYFLPRLIGTGLALEMLLSGNAITAEEAMKIGLVHRVFAPGELAESTVQFAKELSGKSKTASRLIKNLVKNPSTSLEEALQREKAAQLICFQDSEHLRLTEDFLKKRKKDR